MREGKTGKWEGIGWEEGGGEGGDRGYVGEGGKEGSQRTAGREWGGGRQKGGEGEMYSRSGNTVKGPGRDLL